jgi:hypothetical protein
MNRKRGSIRWLSVVLLSFGLAIAALIIADDGPMFRHPVSRTPDMESEKAQLSMMQFYVPATSRDGNLVTLDYYADRDGDNQPDELIETREYAKPLVVSFYDGVTEGDYNASGQSITSTGTVSRLLGRAGHVGEKIKSNTAGQSTLSSGLMRRIFGRGSAPGGKIEPNSGVELGAEYTRDAFTAVSLDDGKTWKEQNLSESALASSFILKNGIVYPGDVPEILHSVAGNKILVAWTSKYCAQGSPLYSLKDEFGNPLYEDLYDVAGNQGSVDYAEVMHHGQYPFASVGEIPFSCVWTARGTVEQVINPQTGLPQWGVRWRKAERLTSGKRDAFYLAIDGVEDAGFVLAWQEDPEGLRPGYGEGPGIGWSGSTVNHKTDIWYSRIGWNDFDAVDLITQPIDTNKPKVMQHMTMPIRLTDNYNCLSDRVDSDGNPHPGFCFADFNLNGTPDFCAETYPWTNSQGVTKNICVTEDGRLLNGQTGSSRTRLMLEGYTKADGAKSAWVIISYEETKGLGAGHSDDPPLDIGKSIKYHSFDMYKPEFVAPGTILNMPETDPATGEFLPRILNDKNEYQYNGTIGRRPSLVVQPGWKIAEAAGNGTAAGMTSAIILYKEGTQRQGGPSDVFMRRFVLPVGFNPAVDNPYAVKNLVCNSYDTAIVGTSPSAYPASAYPKGVCLSGAINLSAATPLTFEPLDNTDQLVMPDWHMPTNGAACSTCHEASYDEGLPSHGITERVLTWTQTPQNLLDEHWTNKYDVSKGHRGFIDGNFVMMMYVYSPNWLATSHGNEPSNLMIRRSFDGGVTWTTTPASLGGQGVTYDQVFGVGDRVWTETRTLAAGAFEPARNVSQITTSKETVLDPRYSPTNIGTQKNVDRILQADGTYRVVPGGVYPDDDIRDPSKFLVVYETGDATTVLTHGEADPLDLFSSRATNWGDFWHSVDFFAQGRGEWEERWDWLENKKDVYSGEASIAASPGGQYGWVVWNEWMQTADGHVYQSDPMFRRLWYDDTEILIADAGDYTAVDGQLVTLTGSATVRSASRTTSLDLTYSWDLDMDGIFETKGQIVEVVATGAAQGVALRVCNAAGKCDVDQGWINKNNRAPRVRKTEITPAAASVGTLVNLFSRFTVPGPDNTHTAFVDWGDGVSQKVATIPPTGNGASTIYATHIYKVEGFYTVKVTVTSAAGYSGWDYLNHAVIFNRANGSVDASDLQFQDPNGGGTAELGFSAKHTTTLVIDGRLKFKLGSNFLFESLAHDWYVAEQGGKITIQGTNGALNGEAGYHYLITAIAGKPDLVRVNIWEKNGNNRKPVYDSQPGADDYAQPTTAVTKGRIKIETK